MLWQNRSPGIPDNSLSSLAERPAQAAGNGHLSAFPSGSDARIDAHFVQPLDLDDNTGCGHPLAGMVASFNPSWDSEASSDGAHSPPARTAPPVR